MLTSDASRCEYYKKHSFNVESKGWSYLAVYNFNYNFAVYNFRGI